MIEKSDIPQNNEDDPLISILKASDPHVGKDQKLYYSELIDGWTNFKKEQSNNENNEIPKPLESKAMVSINSYKLFYYRYRRKYEIAKLAEISGIDEREIYKLETVNEKPFDESFPQCELETLYRLEKALGLNCTLKAGQSDDFHSKFIMSYAINNKGNKIHPKPLRRGKKTLFPTKIVVFDFDGTLTQDITEETTTWEKIWLLLGYSIEDCDDLHRRFREKEITHQQWCDETLDAFRKKELSKNQVISMAEKIRLVDGAKATLNTLRGRGIKLYMLSGSITQVIQHALGDIDWPLFKEIKANDFIFDDSDILKEIDGTEYDFENKKEYLKKVVSENRVSPLDVLYIGNSNNDEWAILSGVRTLCVNPDKTNHLDVNHWTYYIRNLKRLNQILEYIP